MGIPMDTLVLDNLISYNILHMIYLLKWRLPLASFESLSTYHAVYCWHDDTRSINRDIGLAFRMFCVEHCNLKYVMLEQHRPISSLGFHNVSYSFSDVFQMFVFSLGWFRQWLGWCQWETCHCRYPMSCILFHHDVWGVRVFTNENIFVSLMNEIDWEGKSKENPYNWIIRPWFYHILIGCCFPSSQPKNIKY